MLIKNQFFYFNQISFFFFNYFFKSYLFNLFFQNIIFYKIFRHPPVTILNLKQKNIFYFEPLSFNNINKALVLDLLLESDLTNKPYLNSKSSFFNLKVNNNKKLSFFESLKKNSKKLLSIFKFYNF